MQAECLEFDSPRLHFFDIFEFGGVLVSTDSVRIRARVEGPGGLVKTWKKSNGEEVYSYALAV